MLHRKLDSIINKYSNDLPAANCQQKNKKKKNMENLKRGNEIYFFVVVILRPNKTRSHTWAHRNYERPNEMNEMNKIKKKKN